MQKSLENNLIYLYTDTISRKYRAFVVASLYLSGVRYREITKLGFSISFIGSVIRNRRFMNYVYNIMTERILSISIMSKLYGINENIYPLPYVHLSLSEYVSDNFYYLHPFNVPQIKEELVYLERRIDGCKLDSVEQFLEHVNKLNTKYEVKKVSRNKKKYVILRRKSVNIDGKRNMRRRRKRKCVGEMV